MTFASGTTSPSVDVSVTNDTGGPATLHGWIDADGDGAFQADEHASANVAAGAPSAALQWTGLPALIPGAQPYLRLRLTTDNLADSAPTPVDDRSRGAASDGEVEDHRALVERPEITCATDAATFNTAFNGAGGKLPAGSRDRNWEVGLGNATGPASVAGYVPAFVIPPVAGAWSASPFGNADWISYNTNGSHAARVDMYVRYRFRIDPDGPARWIRVADGLPRG